MLIKRSGHGVLVLVAAVTTVASVNLYGKDSIGECIDPKSAVLRGKSSETADSDIEEGVIDPSLNGLPQDDPELIRALQERFLVPPPEGNAPINFKGPLGPQVLGGQFGQPYRVDEIYKGQKHNGFFIEAGAADGTTYSNTLFFELKRNWTGLLVEPNPEFFAQLASRNRQAALLPHCLSTVKSPQVVEFDASALIGGIIQEGRIKPGDIGRPPNYTDRPYHRRSLRIQCFPVYSLLLALGNPTVDYFSLDIEGAEYPVLKTIPFDKVDIRMFDIEVNHAGKVFDGSAEDIIKFMQNNGYDLHSRINIDLLFVKRMMKK